MFEIAAWMRAHQESNLWFREPDFSCWFHWTYSFAKLIQRLRR